MIHAATGRREGHKNKYLSVARAARKTHRHLRRFARLRDAARVSDAWLRGAARVMKPRESRE